MKEKIRDQIIQKLQNELVDIETASQTTTAYSQSDDLKSEGKYDTRAIEAKYLADAQRSRVNQIKDEIASMQNFSFIQSHKVIIGSIVTLSEGSFFILPISGQGDFICETRKFKTLYYKTELAQELIGLELEDEFEHPVSGKELLITKII